MSDNELIVGALLWAFIALAVLVVPGIIRRAEATWDAHDVPGST
jgi:hypothetical protein